MKKISLILLALSLTLSASQGGSGPLKEILKRLKQERDTISTPVDTVRADSLNPRK